MEVVTDNEFIFRHIRFQEFSVKRTQAATKKYGRDISSLNVVFNLRDMTFSTDQSGMKLIAKFLAIDQNYYPERLKRFFVINAPIFFTAVWAMVRPFLDADTVAKFKIIGSNYLPTLLEFINDDQIPEDWGGSMTCPWHWPANRNVDFNGDYVIDGIGGLRYVG
jgi:hypothetical protein